MAYDEQLADRVRSALDGQTGLGERKMFGGLAFMVHGNMACGVEGRWFSPVSGQLSESDSS